jgi:hypothetical protein
LFATGYVLSQKDLIDVADLEEAVRELPIGEYLTYQRRISDIEDETGLRFFYAKPGGGRSKYKLSDVDPMSKESAASRRRRARSRTAESTDADDRDALTDFSQIILP